MVKKKGYWLLLFIAVFLSTSGCYSLMWRLDYPVAKTLSTGWSQKGGEYEFKYKDVSTFLSASYTPGESIAWLGPPLIPFIPRFLFAPFFPKRILGKLDLSIRIESPNDTAGLEISQIQVWGADEKPLHVDPHSVYLRFGSDGKYMPSMQPMVSKGQLKVSLECHSTLEELERFTIDLGGINVGEENIKLPPLKFRKKSKYLYLPIGFDGHWEDRYYPPTGG